MRTVAIITSVMLSLASIGKLGATEHKHGISEKKQSVLFETQRPSEVKVANGDWGNVNTDDIALLLNAVVAEMSQYFPDRQLDTITVFPAQHGPVVLYEKGPKNEYQVLLAAKGEHWAEYVYEFSHELFHIFSRYEYHAPPHRVRHQWFEEMLCEAVSLHMLKRFSAKWEQSPPKAEWKGYAHELHQFTRRALSEHHRQLPANVSFEEWFLKNESRLVDQPYLRKKNELVATIFLPLIEEVPDWRAVSYLNVDHQEGEANFRNHLARWYRKTPPSQREFVARAAAVFNLHRSADTNQPKRTTNAFGLMN